MLFSPFKQISGTSMRKDLAGRHPSGTGRPGNRFSLSSAKRLSSLTLAVLLAVGAAACDSTPTSPVQEDFVFEATIASGGGVEHRFTLPEDGTVRITLASIDFTETPIEGEDTPAFEPGDVSLGIQLARGETDCMATSELNYQVGDSFLFNLTAIEYCVSVADNGSLPATQTANYRLTVGPSTQTTN